jgi:hypothetical protein
MWIFPEPCYEATPKELSMRAACAVILITSLLASSALAGANDGALPPGKPAGTKQAQSTMTVGTVVLAGAAALGVLLAIQSGGAAAIAGGTPPANATDLAAREASTLNTTR